ncbi:MAG TPA: transglutaminase domain-containing protein [Thermoleophilaceae bacterium]|nr:transglutaminase domain-containing protein [Thermoleophilaceae bacterium]
MSGPVPHLGSAGRQHAAMGGALRPAAATAGAPASAAPAAAAVSAPASEVRLALIRLATFAALALFGAAHWAGLVGGVSLGRTLLVVLVAVGGAAVLVLLGTASSRRLLTRALGGRPRGAGALIAGLALLTGFVTLCLGLGAAGLPLRLLGPENWGELTDGLDRGLGGVQGVNWPYDGEDWWIRQTILLGAPFLLAIAATLAFFPSRRGASLFRAAGLVVLLVLYGTAVVEHDPGQPLLRGFVLLVLVGAWLWLPRLGTREALAGAAVVVALGVMSLPPAAALDGDDPWWDYRAWNWFGGGTPITFSWNHEYGPLDWPREGTTLLNIRSDRPHYWKAETLDGFDGLRWVRTRDIEIFDDNAELPEQFGFPQGRTWDLHEYNQRWDEEIEVTVRSLTSELIVGAGTTYEVDGARVSYTADGTTRLLGDPLEEGDSYTVHAYAPDPNRNLMRRSTVDGYPDRYGRYTRIFLPGPGENAIDGVGLQGDASRSEAFENREAVTVPLRNEPSFDEGSAEEALRISEYARVYDLALRWTAGERTPYDAVKAIETRLQDEDEYTYAERVPTREIPLHGFLFQEKRGYCQQFSGAMALMLRMVGIPARVAAGFSPGSYNQDTKEFRVRDLDAHSWVEVYFTGIGWVPFDPTPIRAPAESQSSGLLATSAARGDAGEVSNPRAGVAAERAQEGLGGQLEEDEGPGWMLRVLALLALAAIAAAGATLVLRIRARRGLTPEQLAEAQLAELRRALDRLDWEVPAATTLLGLERRLGRVAGPASARYAAGLRAHRYDPRAPRAPGWGERRELRRELSSRAGLAGRLRGLLAIPPGGPTFTRL